MRSVRILFGVSVFWLALSMLSDGLNTLFLPYALLRLGGDEQAAGTAGLLRAGRPAVQPALAAVPVGAEADERRARL